MIEAQLGEVGGASGAMRGTVAEAMKEVLARFTPDQLAVGLQQAGYVSGKTGERYSKSNIYGWARGTALPPVDVFLAAMWLARISLDEYLYADAATHAKERQRLAALERGLADEIAARHALSADVERMAALMEGGAEKLEAEKRERENRARG